MNEQLIKAALYILAGALSGGLTNTVAIWMLFHPYEPPKLLGRWRLRFFQGAIPKNQPRLAAAIGRTVGDRLLTAEDLTKTFTDETFRAAFDDRLAEFLDGVLNTERAALRDMIPERVMPDIEVLLDEGIDKALAQLDAYLESERFAESMQRRAADLVEAESRVPPRQPHTRLPRLGDALEPPLRLQVAELDVVERGDHVDDVLQGDLGGLAVGGRLTQRFARQGQVDRPIL